MANPFLNRFFPVLAIIASSLILVPHQLAAQEPLGALHSSEKETMKPRMGDSSFYNESWTYHIMLDNGVYIIYAFNIADFGTFKSRATGAKYQVTWTDGNTYVVRKEYDPEEFIYDSTNNYIRLHPERTYWARGSFNDVHRLNFDTKKDNVDYHAELELYDIADSQIWGDGNFQVRGKKVSLSFPIPHAKVRGMVALNGDTLRNVSGVAFMDHTHISDKVTDLFNRGYRIKYGDNRNGLVGHFIDSRDSRRLIGYGVKYENGTPRLVRPTRFEVRTAEKIRGKEYGETLAIYFEKADPITVTMDQVMKDYSILDELSGFQKFFAKRYLGGEVIEFNGVGSTQKQQKIIFNNYVID